MRGEITFLIPDHVSSMPPSDGVFWIINRAGIVWHELAPILLRASPETVAKLVKVILHHSERSNSRVRLGNGQQAESGSDGRGRGEGGKSQDGNIRIYPGFCHRTFSSKTLPSFTAAVVPSPPSLAGSPDFTFLSVVLRAEHRVLKLQTASAVLSTLGGGYFFCKRLNVSLRLARRQKALASELGDAGMVRQCAINEAYSLIYAGDFSRAERVLSELERGLEDGGSDDATALKQCNAARLFARRLEQVAGRGTLRRYDRNCGFQSRTVDDYQRIRIVAS